MSDLQITIVETVEKACDELCKYSDEYLISCGGMSCKQYCAKHDCPFEHLLKEMGLE